VSRGAVVRRRWVRAGRHRFDERGRAAVVGHARCRLAERRRIIRADDQHAEHHSAVLVSEEVAVQHVRPRELDESLTDGDRTMRVVRQKNAVLPDVGHEGGVEAQPKKARAAALPRPPYASLRINIPSFTRSGSSSSAIRAWFTLATMIWPTSVLTSLKMPCAFILAAWYWLSSVGVT
jgi:hypothetical protein